MDADPKPQPKQTKQQFSHSSNLYESNPILTSNSMKELASRRWLFWRRNTEKLEAEVEQALDDLRWVDRQLQLGQTWGRPGELYTPRPLWQSYLRIMRFRLFRFSRDFTAGLYTSWKFIKWAAEQHPVWFGYWVFIFLCALHMAYRALGGRY